MSMPINEKCLFLVLSILRYHMVTVKRGRLRELREVGARAFISYFTSPFFPLNLLLAHIKMMNYLTSTTFVFFPFCFSSFLHLPLPSSYFFFLLSSLFSFLPMYYFKNEFILSLAILGRLTEALLY